MRALVAGLALMVSSCQSLSYIEPEFADSNGLVASEIVDAVSRRSQWRSVHVAPPEQHDHPFAGTVDASLRGAGYSIDEEGDSVPTLRYYVTKLYDGILLRVDFASAWTARFFAKDKASLVPAGPVTVQEFAG